RWIDIYIAIKSIIDLLLVRFLAGKGKFPHTAAKFLLFYIYIWIFSDLIYACIYSCTSHNMVFFHQIVLSSRPRSTYLLQRLRCFFSKTRNSCNFMLGRGGYINLLVASLACIYFGSRSAEYFVNIYSILYI
ncbi:hypothetical protein ACJX0J_020445, partial [Zea mays]